MFQMMVMYYMMVVVIVMNAYDNDDDDHDEHNDLDDEDYCVMYRILQVMVWSEKTSGEVLGDQGMMGTHDMETYKYFKDAKNYRGSNKVSNQLFIQLTSSFGSNKKH